MCSEFSLSQYFTNNKRWCFSASRIILAGNESQPAATEAKHRVYFRKLFDPCEGILLVGSRLRTQFTHDFLDVPFWKELVEGRVQESDGHRES